MSYTQQVRKTIYIRYSGTVSYPASQSGGSVSYSGTASEEVIVNVNVDTNPFDASSANCRKTVDGLTASVAATEIAQVASIKDNSRKVGKTLIDGFFKTVRSEISQQINELKNNVEATLLKLQSDAKRCNDMQHQMEVDYNRKCEQYLKLFSDLDTELKNRIQSLDQPTFAFRDSADHLSSRLERSGMVPTVSIAGGENALLGAQLSASLTKQRAYETLGKASRFLCTQKHTADTINSSIIDSTAEGKLYLPICFIEISDSSGTVGRNIYIPKQLEEHKAKISESLRDHQWDNVSDECTAAIQRFFNEEVASIMGASPHDDRVREQIIRLFNN